MRHPSLVLGAVAALLVSDGAAASSAEDGPSGIALGLRTGYGAPFGQISGSGTATASGLPTTITGTPERDTISGQIPLWLDLGYRIAPHYYVGAFLAYGFGILPTNVCTGSVSCSVHEIRFGVDAHYHFLPTAKLDPWAGLGVGYEILGLSQSLGGISSTMSLSGFEFVSVQAGADYKVSPRIGVGPFLAFSVGQYQSVTAGGTDLSGFPTAIHEWLTLGVRGEFDVAIVGPSSDRSAEPADTPPSPPPPATSEPRPPPPTPAVASAGSPVPPPPPPAPPMIVPPPPPPPPPPPAPLPPGVWPPGVPVADRSQCNLLCVSDRGESAGDADKRQLVSQLAKHLGAIRSCLLQNSSTQLPTVSVRFDARGVGTADFDPGGRGRPVGECIANIPRPPAVSGPPNVAWRCTDYCQ